MFTILSTIFSITILELMLSVDNALVNASLAEDLPAPLQRRAVFYGIGLGAIFRVICLLVATLIIQNPIIKIAGGIYLLYVAYSHFFGNKDKDPEFKRHPHFWRVIGQIALADLVFSIDNVIGAVGISSHFTYVVFGVLIGIVTMMFITTLMLLLMNKFPTLIKTAYGIIAYVGFAILIESFTHFHISEYITFILILIAVGATIVFDYRTKKVARTY